MSLIDRVKGLIKGKGPESTGFSNSLYTNKMAMAPALGTTQLFASYETSPWLRAVTSTIADDIGSVAWKLYATRNKAGKAVKHAVRHYEGPIRKKTLKSMINSGNLQEIEDHPLLDLLQTPNNQMSGHAEASLTSLYLDFAGEAFFILEYNGFGMPVQMWPVPPTWVLKLPVLPDSPYYSLSIMGKKIAIPMEQMIWFRKPNLQNPYARGTGTGQSLGNNIDTYEYATAFLKSFFYNNAKPDMFVSLEGGSQESADRVQQAFDDKFRGAQRAHRTTFMSGKLNIYETQNRLVDMQVLELLKHERDSFLQLYGVSPEQMGIVENSNRATIAASGTVYARRVIVPRLEFRRLELQRQLVPLFDERLILEYDNPVPEDSEFKLQVMQAAPYAFSVAEIRELAGEEDRGACDQITYVPFNLIAQHINAKLPSGAPPPPVDDTQLDDLTPVKSKKKVLKAKAPTEQILEGLRPQTLNAELDPIFKKLVDEWGNQAFTDLGLSPDFNMADPKVVEFLKTSGTRITGVSDTTRDALRATLEEGFSSGESIPDIAARVGDVFSAAQGYRAEMIARTEVVGSSNAALDLAYSQSGLVSQKEWISTKDDRTRDDHIAMDGKLVGIDESFVLPDGSSGNAPGQTGVAEQDINCRCTISAVTSAAGASTSANVRSAYWKMYDRKLIPWETRMRRAAQDGFAKQQTEILARLHKV